MCHPIITIHFNYLLICFRSWRRIGLLWLFLRAVCQVCRDRLVVLVSKTRRKRTKPTARLTFKINTSLSVGGITREWKRREKQDREIYLGQE